MRPYLSGVLMLALVLGGYVWYETAYSKCRIPITYTVGSIDPRFDTNEGAVRTALSDAESLWEDATGKNLFTYADDAAVTVNFIYDERQETTNEEELLESELDEKADVNASIREEYEDLIETYEDQKRAYEARVRAYEASLEVYNKEVDYWNSQGGAPEEKYDDLADRGQALEKESANLNTTARYLNQISQKLNELTRRGNEIVEDYNENAAEFNDRFSEDREFTQGDFQEDRINVYQYRDGGELVRVLAHEFGHALGLEHVEHAESIMYYLMEGTMAKSTPSKEDLAEFDRVCGDR